MEAPSSSIDVFPNPKVLLDAEARDCWELAAWVGQRPSGDPARSFTSLLVALLHANNALSKWFFRYARAAGISIEAIHESIKFQPAELRSIREKRERGETPASREPWTRSTEAIVDSAVGLLNRANASELSVRHLLGAYFYYLPEDHLSQMQAWGFDRSREASALLRQVKNRYPSELEIWVTLFSESFKTPPALDANDPLLPSRISSFAPDTPEGEDQLGIEDDVYALSALICSTRIDPPLSLGLFGDWGSGKSFFIKQLQKGVAWISEQARGSDVLQRDLPFFKHVVQIEFNAWNYSAGNLWAALVQHILDNLRLSKGEDDNLVEARRKRLQSEMELERKVREAAEQKEADAKRKVTAAQNDLELKRKTHEEKITQLAKARAPDVLRTARLDPVTEGKINDLLGDMGMPKVSGSIADFLAALDGSRAVLRRASAVFGRISRSDRSNFALGLTLVLFGPPVVAIGLGYAVQAISPHITSIASFTGWLSTMLALAAGWIRNRTTQVSQHIAKVEALQSLAQKRVEAEVENFRAQAASLEQEIRLARDEVLAAQAHQREVVMQLEKIEAQLNATTPSSVLADFVQERSESDDYRKYLGLPAVIRRDFQSISDMVAMENKALKEMSSLDQEKLNAEKRINRIVLYIDDLDRCSEELVVEVLQAVHLLLAFRLFVVVVAVDARWVSRSLAKRFPGLLTAERQGCPLFGSGGDPQFLCGARAQPDQRSNETNGGNATPDDYLEKIFQIPFWLRPPAELGVRRMLRSLMEEGLPAGATVVSTGDAVKTSEGAVPPPPVFKHRQHAVDAKSLDITLPELEYIEKLAPLLDRSPRALKRFVNVYRLLKASLSPEEEDDFLEENGALGAPFKNVLLLLAVVTGLPRLSDDLIDGLLAAGYRSPGGKAGYVTLGELIESLDASQKDPNDEAARLVAWLDQEVGMTWRGANPNMLLNWVPRVSRYSYRLHRGFGF